MSRRVSPVRTPIGTLTPFSPTSGYLGPGPLNTRFWSPPATRLRLANAGILAMLPRFAALGGSPALIIR
jgi:hypothetical protein